MMVVRELLESQSLLLVLGHMHYLERDYKVNYYIPKMQKIC